MKTLEEFPKIISVYFCEICNLNLTNNSNYNKHIRTKKHIEKQNNTFSNLYKCDICNYKTNKKTNYTKHVNTSKHINKIKKINEQQKTENTIIQQNKDLIKQNRELTQFINSIIPHIDGNILKSIEVPECIKEHISDFDNPQTTIENVKFEILEPHTDYINNSYIEEASDVTKIEPTIQNFLNEDCKNAIYMKTFFQDFEFILNEFISSFCMVPFVKGFSDYIYKELKKYDIYSRPIHCIFDSNNNPILYMKDEDLWKNNNQIFIDGIKYLIDKMKPEYKKYIENKKAKYVEYFTPDLLDYREDDILQIIQNIGKLVKIDNSMFDNIV